MKDGLSNAAAPRDDPRFIVEDGFIHGAKLFDAQVAIGNGFAAGMIGRGPRRQCQKRSPRRLVVEVAALGQRSPRWCKETTIEGGDMQIAGMTAAVRQARDGAQRVPQSRRIASPLRPSSKSIDAVALPIQRVPQRHEPASLGKEKKQNAIDDRQRLLEGLFNRTMRAPCDQRAEQIRGSLQNTQLKRSADDGPVLIRLLDQSIELSLG